MNEYIEKAFNSLIPDNKGYKYIRTENIFIPIYRVTLSITKRKQTRINLVEEIVLKLVNCGLSNLDEISGVLGLNRAILDITIGDLFNKNLAYHSSNKCYLMSEGRNVLRDLKFIKKEKDSLRNIYVNAINQDIFKEKNINIIDRCSDNDCKVHHVFNGKDIEFYRNNIGNVKEIFNNENQIYSVDSNQIADELVSIDEVEDINVCYLKIPAHIYISETGIDIDITATDNSLNNLLIDIKSTILQQFAKHTLLKKIFTKFAVKDTKAPEGKFDNTYEIKELIKKYVTDKDNKECYYNLVSDKVYSNRILLDNELEKLFELSIKDFSQISFYVDNLDYWSKNSKFITLLTLVPAKAKYNIYYCDVANMSLAEKRFRFAVPRLSKDMVIQNSHNNWFRIVFNDKIQIIGCPENYKAIDAFTWVIKCNYYLSIL